MADASNNGGIPKGMRILVRFWGAVSGLCSAALGFFVLFTLSATCLGMGIYMMLAILPVIFCLEVSTFVGCGSIMITAALYGVLAIGKKGADANQNANNEDIEMKTNLVDNKGDPNQTEP